MQIGRNKSANAKNAKKKYASYTGKGVGDKTKAVQNGQKFYHAPSAPVGAFVFKA